MKSVNELKYKVCIFDIEMFKEKNLILKHDIDNVFCFHEKCSYSLSLKLYIMYLYNF